MTGGRPTGWSGQGEERLGVLFGLIEVVEEHAADAAAFASVRDVEVLVTPFLESGVVGTIVSIASVFDRLVEVNGVFIEEVRGCEIGSASEPPCICRAIGVGGFKVAVVEVNGRCHGVMRVQDERQTSSEEFQAVHIRVERFVVDAHLCNGGARKSTIHHGDVDASFLKDIAILQHA